MISVFFIYLLLRGISFESLISVFNNINYFWLVLAFIFAIGDLYIRAFKWHVVLDGKTTLQESLKSFFLGFTLNAVFPLRLGDIGRTFVISKTVKIRSGLGAVIFERIVEGLTLVLFFAISLAMMSHPDVILTNMFYFTLCVFVLLIVLMYLLIIFREKFTWFFEKIHLGFVNNTLILVCEGFEDVKNVKYLLKVLFLSCVMWIISFFMFYFVFLAVGLYVPSYVVMLCVVMLSFVIILPSAPGGIGLVEYSLMLTLSLFSVIGPISLSLVILIRLLLLLQGLLALYLAGTTLLKEFYGRESAD